MSGKNIFGNIQPPVKCNIIDQNKSFDQWPIYQTSQLIQNFVYGLKYSDFLSYFSNPIISKEQHDVFFKTSGLNVNYRHVQGLNLIFNMLKIHMKV